MTLVERIADRGSELLLFALTPPRLTTTPERAQEIADATIARLAGLDLDGLVLYDIDDESDRNPDERPFPFAATLDPATFRERHLGAWAAPVVVYRSAGKHSEHDLRSWLGAQDTGRTLTVLVGASSSATPSATTLRRAQELRAEVATDLLLGGVAIPERHTRRGDEHERMVAKQRAGCSFFVTQVVYDVNAAKDLVSNYCHHCAEVGLEPAPVVFTFSVCGSERTLEFLQWLGVDVPRWIQDDLRHADDTLQASFDQALATARELAAFCRRREVPFGFNVESVSIRAVEIEASVALAAQLGHELRRGPGSGHPAVGVSVT